MNTIEPTVIDEGLLHLAVSDQVSNEVAEVARKEGIDPKDVTSLRLDYKNILKIDNLYEFFNLRKLQLDNNIIEKIDNLRFLKHLTWLDLSFNNITTIEGLDQLVNLTDLSLHSNQITNIQGLDNLVNLAVFSIGNNKIESLDSITYISSKLKKLRILNMAGNPVAKNENYKLFTLSRLRNLKYLDYRLVDSESLKMAREKHLDELIAIEEEEKMIVAQHETQVQHEKRQAVYKKAHIPGADDMMSDIFDHDPDFQKLLPLIQDIFKEFVGENLTKSQEKVKELKDVALKKMAEKEKELNLYQQAMDEGRKAQTEECIKIIDRFSNYKKKLTRKLSSVMNLKDSEVEAIFKELKSSVEKLSNDLMTLELDLVEQSEDLIKDFQSAYSEHSSHLVEAAQAIFSQLREFENEFFERFNELVALGAEKAAKSHLDELSDQVRDLVTDKELLITTINATHDFRTAKLDQFEDMVVSGSQKEAEAIVNQVQTEEIQRNRSRVSEIIRYTLKVSEEITHLEDNYF